MVSEATNLWFCDTFVYTPWQFYFLVVPLIGAFLYGRGKHKIAWSLIGFWVVVQVGFSALSNLLFSCVIE